MLADQRKMRRHRERDSRAGAGESALLGWLAAGASGQSGGLEEDRRACVSWQAVSPSRQGNKWACWLVCLV